MDSLASERLGRGVASSDSLPAHALFRKTQGLQDISRELFKEELEPRSRKL